MRWAHENLQRCRFGERRAPLPNNHLGYLGADNVHRFDQDCIKGGYQINAVDCITQYDGVAICERISEAFLIPVLEALPQTVPFVIHGFHTDKGLLQPPLV